MANDKTEAETELESYKSLPEMIAKIPVMIDPKHVDEMINLQVSAIDRLETTNTSLINCNTMAQSKLATTSRLFKKTSKMLGESKRDLDIIYKKITDLKAKLRADKPDLFKDKNNIDVVDPTETA